MVSTLDEALRTLKTAVARMKMSSSRLGRELRDVIAGLAERGVVLDIVTDQTSAHDQLNGYVPNSMTLEAALDCAQHDPQILSGAVPRRDGAARRKNVPVAENGQSLSTTAIIFGHSFQRGVKKAYDFPGFVSTYI